MRVKVLMIAPGPPSSSSAYGTEIVAYSLAAGLCASGAEVHVAYHKQPDAPALHHEPDAKPVVHELPPLPRVDREMQLARRTPAVPGLTELLLRVEPDFVQLAGLSAGVGNRRHLEVAKAHGARTVLWHNVPGITCLQTGLLYEGREPCDGRIDVRRCTQCRLRAAGVPGVLAAALSRVGLPGRGPRLPHRVEALARARHLTSMHQRAVECAFNDLDAVRVGALWVRDVLRVNGVPERKIHLIRPGVNLNAAGAGTPPPNIWAQEGEGRAVRLVYWGRIHASKGVHTVLEALALEPELPVEFAVFGKVKETPYGVQIRRQANEDSRVHLYGRISPEQVLPALRTADIAIIPSRWHETGPLTVFEAQAAGLPIIGSNRGGIAELCQGPGASLFPAEDAGALARLLSEVVRQPKRLAQMQQNVEKPRTMQDVEADVRRLYASLLASK